MRSTQSYLFLATVVLCIGQSIQENAQEIQESFHFRRAIDGSRGRKYFNPDEDGSYDSYDSTSGDYDSSQVESGFSDIRSNVPGEPGVNYPTYTSVPKTRFSCHGRMSGYYADEEAGCQVFHVCHNVVVSSFLCPVGSIFSQTLLTCDWWNNVECEVPNDDFFPHQEIPQNEEQMIQKAYEMMQLPKPNSGSSDQQVRGRQLNIAKVADKDNGKTNIREGIAVSGERNPQNYRHYHTEQPPLQENSRLRKNNDDVNDDHTPSKQNLINIRLRPKNFQINRPGEDSRLNDRAKDSSVIYIQKNVNDDSQNAYSTLRPFVIQENFRNSDDHDVNIYKEEFQPSYAPTVPTVTTTTRKLYSPTVPVTTYRPSTTSYKNDDQDLGSSDHLYIHGKNSNILTSQPTVIYEDLTPENNNFTNSVILNRKASEKSDTADKEHHENVAKSVKPTESFGSEVQDTYLSNHKSNIGNTKEEVEIVPSIFNSESYSHGQNYQHFYADQDSLSEEFRARVTGKREGFLVDNYANAALQTGLVNDGKKEDSDIFNSPGKIPPLIVQLPRPLGSSDSSSIDIRDQLFTFNTFNMSLAPIPQAPQLGGSLGINSKDTMSANVTSERPNMIPLLIPQNSPPMLSSGIRSPGAIYDENTSNEPRISTPSISEIGSSGTVRADVDSRIQTSASSTRIPPRISQTLEAPSRPLLISQISQSAGLPGAVLTDTADRPQTSQPSDTIPPLIPQSLDANSDRNVIDASTRIPPLITQTSQPAGLPGVDLSDVTDSTQNSQSPDRIPLVITSSMNSNNNENISGAPARIPPLIWQISQSAESVRIDSTDVMNRTQISQPSNSTTSPIPQSLDGNSDRNAFDASTRIPPLITQTVQPTGLSEGGLSDVTNRTQNSQLPTRIPLVIPQSTSFHNNENMPVAPARMPPLIWQISQSAESAGIDSTHVVHRTQVSQPSNSLTPPILQSSAANNDKNVFDTSTRIPPLITQSSGVVSADSANRTETSKPFTNIPSLIPQSLDANNDENIFDTATRVPSLITQTSGLVSTDSVDRTETSEPFNNIPPLIPQSSDANNDENIFGTATRVPPLITQTSGVESTDSADTTETSEPFNNIPPLIPQSSDANNDENIFDTATKVPPLITQTSGVISTDSADRTETSEPFNNIPPLIPQSSDANTDENIFDTATRVPPLITQTSGVESTDSADTTETSEPFINIPPLIPQSSDANDDENIFDTATKVPPLITQTSGVISTDSADRTETSEPFNNIPPLIPQSSDANNDENIFDTATRVPPLITQASGVISTDYADRTETSEPFNNIPPLIPQSSDANNDENIFDTTTRVPPSITVTPGVVSTDITDRTETATSEPFNNIPPLIPQSSDANTDENIFDTATRVPPLITETSGVISTDTTDRTETETSESSDSIPPLIPQSSDANNEENIFDITTRVPPLVTQTSGVVSTDSVDRTETSKPFNNIPPLIPKSSDANNDENIFDTATRVPPLITETSAVVSLDTTDRIETETSESSNSIPPLIQQSSDANNDENIFDTATRVPPLIIQTSGVVSTDSADRTETETSQSSNSIPPLIPQSSDANNDTNVFNTPTRIPSLIPGTVKSTPSFSAQNPSTVNSQNVSGKPPNIPPFISQIPQGGDSMVVIHQPQTLDVSTVISPPIPQTSKSTEMPVTQFPCVFTEINSVSCKNPPMLSKTPNSSNSSDGVLVGDTEKEHVASSSPYIPPLITDVLQPPKLPAIDLMDIFNRRPAILPSTEVPPLIQTSNAPDPWTVPLHDLSNPFHPSFSSAPGKLYLSPKEYQRPMSFNSIQIPQQQLGDQLAIQPPVKHLTYDSSVGNPETKNSQFAVVESTSKESSTTSYPNIASTLSPPRFDNPFVTPSGKSLEADTSDTRGPIAQGFIPAGYNENIRFHTGGASLYPQFYTIPSTLISQAVKSSLDTQGEKTIGLQNSQSADDSTSLLSSEIVPHNEYRQNTMANVFSKATSAESNVRFESSTPKNVLDITGITTTGKFDASNKDSVQALRPNISAAGLPVSLSQIEDSINNSNDLPYEIAFTINAGEDFNPSGDFISKLLAQHQNNGSPGFAGLEGYEIIRSDDIETSVNEQNLEPTVAPTIAPAIAPTITPTLAPTVQSNTAGGRLLFDPRISLEDNQSGKRIIFSNPLLSPATITRSKSVGNRAEEIDPVKSEVLPRPSPFGTEQSVALNSRLNSKFDYLSILNQPSSTSNRDVNLLAQDINGSLEALFASAQKTAVTSIPSREQLLEELTKNFGQPYFSSDTHQSYFTPPTTSANINYKFPSTFVNLEQYRTGKKASGWQSAPTSPELPKTPTTTSTTTTTTTTTPKPIKTFVETEFIPSLSFSFDSDYERKAYVDAVLNGFVTENQFIDPWRDTASTYWEPSQT
ncbi:mucin-16-like isoform X2 [Neodiprion virginianus]|uniref:mucin-16-like isoform X2 n=1 Tax=Neodiprion virginianus TaxID=2961670 RepID=UPI001EE69685|nr:mucin-16-like isoform X2 [Neodiprion virginianus]